MILPLGKRVLIRADEVASSQKIILTNQRPTRFLVMHIGDDVTKVCPGDIVYLDKYAGSDLEYEGEKFMVVEESSIIAKVKPIGESCQS